MRILLLSVALLAIAIPVSGLEVCRSAAGATACVGNSYADPYLDTWVSASAGGHFVSGGPTVLYGSGYTGAGAGGTVDGQPAWAGGYVYYAPPTYWIPWPSVCAYDGEWTCVP